MSKRPLRTQIKGSSLSLIGIPKKFHSACIDDFNAEGLSLNQVKDYIEDYISDIDKRFDTCEGICFYGSNGTGKTMLSCIVLKEVYKWRYTCRRVTFSQYMSLYTDVWDCKGGEKEIAVGRLHDYKSAEFLVLEEIGKEINSSVAVPILEDLLRYREDEGLVTIICMNLSPDTLRETYGESIYSLITGNLTPVKLVTTDYRTKAFKERKESELM